MAAYIGRGVHGNTVELLGARIVSGAVGEGETLDLAGLSAELDLSITALREAIKVLTAKGLVDARQRRGTFVRPRATWNLLDVDVIRWQFAAGAADDFLRDLAEVRAVIEPAAARYAAARRTEDDLRALDEALAAMGRAVGGDPSSAADADLAWHRALLVATHNEMLVRMEIFIEPGLSERDRLVHQSGDDDPVPSHQAVLDAVRAADAEAAGAAMLALLAKSDSDLRRVTAGEGVAAPAASAQGASSPAAAPHAAAAERAESAAQATAARDAAPVAGANPETGPATPRTPAEADAAGTTPVAAGGAEGTPSQAASAAAPQTTALQTAAVEASAAGIESNERKSR
ncbi:MULTISPECIES: FadR/GntR family transcriptional regulator [Actinoalloteichus]|uniref:Transcriptional regulator n=1 Tax=Actinoalloteichus fjordicus TaxID=1612552 RepID=A0AAC9LCD4_9PSEU|nr:MULTISPECIES: FCD domain-containing protein [Actinoalloteichus]APU14726.1 transcriptional regulator [Actinoalloteichus fjordicus]APU20694.1 transcriptional regulator [Actinoalloteichus sp. GBA129-24]